MGYYRLLPTAILRIDDNGATIYDTIFPKRLNYSSEERDFLVRVFSTQCDEEQFREHEKEIIGKLMRKGYCYCYDKPAYNDEHKEKRMPEIRGLNEQTPRFYCVYFEVPGSNVMEDGKFGKVQCGCQTCAPWKRSTPMCKGRLDLEQVMKRVSFLWVDKVVLSGGNPLDNWDEVIRYVREFRKYRTDVCIEIHMPCMSVINEKIVFLREQNIDLCVTVLPDQKEEAIRLTNVLMENGIKVSFALVGEREDVFLRKCSELGIPVECIEKSLQIRSAEDNYDRRIERVTSSIWKNEVFHPCLNGIMAITADGMVRPCPMIEDNIADLSKTSIDELFQNGGMDRYWRFNKRDMEFCKDCRNRFLCEDCAVLEFGVNRGSIASEIMCDRQMI